MKTLVNYIKAKGVDGWINLLNLTKTIKQLKANFFDVNSHLNHVI